MIYKTRCWTLTCIAIAILTVVSGCGGLGGLGGSDIEGGQGPEVLENGVRFTLYTAEAEKVAIAGSFNNWSKSVDLLSYDEEEGVWEITIPLQPGRYEYRFVIDDKDFIHDPGNQNTVDDGFGDRNSVIVVQ